LFDTNITYTQGHELIPEAAMTEELFLKLCGATGVIILIVQAGTGVLRTYREKFSRPDMVVYRFDSNKDSSEKTANVSLTNHVS